MQEAADQETSARTPISLYEFYAIGIGRLLERAPWELERAISAYHESFLTEQRCLGLAILLLLGEEQVPQHHGALPGYEAQARTSVNQAVFLRALKHYFAAKNLNQVRAEMVLERMHSYLTDSRAANAAGQSPLDAMLHIVMKRVPPQSEAQREGYAERVEKIYDYVDGLVNKAILKRYEITT
jgi:hypothetical protein